MPIIDPIPEELRENMNKTGKVLAEMFQPYGFALLVFDMGQSGRMNYIYRMLIDKI